MDSISLTILWKHLNFVFRFLKETMTTTIRLQLATLSIVRKLATSSNHRRFHQEIPDVFYFLPQTSSAREETALWSLSTQKLTTFWKCSLRQTLQASPTLRPENLSWKCTKMTTPTMTSSVSSSAQDNNSDWSVVKTNPRSFDLF